MSRRHRRRSRRKVGGDIWNRSIGTILDAAKIITTAVEGSNQFLGYIAKRCKDHPNIPLLQPIALWVISISQKLTQIQNATSKIQSAIVEIEDIGHWMVEKNIVEQYENDLNKKREAGQGAGPEISSE